jgi:hypothetical protein
VTSLDTSRRAYAGPRGAVCPLLMRHSEPFFSSMDTVFLKERPQVPGPTGGSQSPFP